MSKRRIKKGDTVVVIAGEDTGKTGKVLLVEPEKDRLLVEGLNLVKKALRKSDSSPQGGIVEREAPLHISNVMLYDPEAKRGVRVSREREGGRSVRKSKASKHVFDQ